MGDMEILYLSIFYNPEISLNMKVNFEQKYFEMDSSNVSLTILFILSHTYANINIWCFTSGNTTSV